MFNLMGLSPSMMYSVSWYSGRGLREKVISIKGSTRLTNNSLRSNSRAFMIAFNKTSRKSRIGTLPNSLSDILS